MKRTLLLAAALLLPAALSSQEIRLELNVPTQQLHVYEGEVLAAQYPVSTGMLGHDTPEGTFQISHAEWNPWWTPPEGREWTVGRVKTPPGLKNPMGRVKLYFAPLYFIHGTPEEEKIGTPASRGCIRMRNRDVVSLAKWLHARRAPHVSERALDAILAAPTQTRSTRLSSPVSFHIRYDLMELVGDTLVFHEDINQRRSLHTEAIVQMLLKAGYDETKASTAEMQAILKRYQERGAMRLSLHEAFPFLRVPRVKVQLAPSVPRTPAPVLRPLFPSLRVGAPQ